jgi:hypothetical protein
MTFDNDGNITFELGEKLVVLPSYKGDPENPLRLIPRFEPCEFRYFKLRSPCGRIVAEWHCHKFKMRVGLKVCEVCNERGFRTAENQSTK